MVWADARCVLTSRDKRSGFSHRGGWRRGSSYPVVKKDICTWMKEDRRPDVRFTTMFDLYGLPVDFPGYAEARRQADPYLRVAILERALEADIHAELNDTRFLSYVQLHEFEALLLADPRKLDREYLEHDAAIGRLVKMVASEGGNSGADRRRTSHFTLQKAHRGNPRVRGRQGHIRPSRSRPYRHASSASAVQAFRRVD